MTRTYKNALLQRTYETMFALGMDRTSSLYTWGTKGGGFHRAAFWAGVRGDSRPCYVGTTGTASAVCFMAGKDCRAVARSA